MKTFLFVLGLVAATLGCTSHTSKPDASASPISKAPVHAALFNPASIQLQPWSVTHNPAAATQATITKAANANGKHVLTDLQACLSAGATAATPVNVYVRDGATGAGTVLWSGAMSVPASTTSCLTVSFAEPLIGTTNTGMTVEFSGAGAAATVETVNGQGYDLQ